MYRLSALVMVCVVALAGCSSQSTRVSETKATIQMSHSHRVLPVWSTQVGTPPGRDYLRLTPALAGDTLYTVDTKGGLFALDAATGKPRWSRNTGVAFGSSPGVAGMLLLVGGRDGLVHAFDRQTGASVWTAKVSTEVLSSPVRDGDVVVAQTADDQLFGLDAASGKRLWVYQNTVPALTLRGHAQPVAAGGRVYAGLASGKLVALSLSDGKLLWEQAVGVAKGRTELDRLVDVDASPLLLRDSVYAVSYQGRVTALDAASGRLRWFRDMSSYSGMTADGNYLYVSDADGGVHAIDRNDGSTLWKQSRLSGRQLTVPALFDGALVVGDEKGILSCLSTEDGSFILRTRLSTEAVRAPRGRWDFWNTEDAVQPVSGTPILGALSVTSEGVLVQDRRGVLVSLRVQRLKDHK